MSRTFFCCVPVPVAPAPDSGWSPSDTEVIDELTWYDTFTAVKIAGCGLGSGLPQRHEVYFKIQFDESAYPPRVSERKVRYWHAKTGGRHTKSQTFVQYECKVTTAKKTPLGYILALYGKDHVVNQFHPCCYGPVGCTMSKFENFVISYPGGKDKPADKDAQPPKFTYHEALSKSIGDIVDIPGENVLGVGYIRSDWSGLLCCTCGPCLKPLCGCGKSDWPSFLGDYPEHSERYLKGMWPPVTGTEAEMKRD